MCRESLAFVFLVSVLTCCFSCSSNSSGTEGAETEDAGTSGATGTSIEDTTTESGSIGGTDTTSGATGTGSDTDDGSGWIIVIDAGLDTDTGTGPDTDTGTGPDTDTSNGLPLGCQVLSPTTAMASGYSGKNSIRDGKLVWTSVTPTQDVLYVKDLESGAVEEATRTDYPRVAYHPSVYKDFVYYSDHMQDGVKWSSELFSVDLQTKDVAQLTYNNTADSYIYPGERYLLYVWGGGVEFETEHGLKLYDLVEEKEIIVDNHLYPLNFDFDRKKWIAYSTSSAELRRVNIENLSAEPELIDPDPLDTMNMIFNGATGELVASVYIGGKTDGYDLVAYNMETMERTVLVNSEWDQGLPGAWGHIVAYTDSAEAGKNWYGNHKGDIKIIDRDTRVTRTILPLDTYYGIGIWDHYLCANNVGRWGDTIVLCDLKVAGLVDEDGHVIPVSTDTETPDAGL